MALRRSKRERVVPADPWSSSSAGALDVLPDVAVMATLRFLTFLELRGRVALSCKRLSRLATSDGSFGGTLDTRSVSRGMLNVTELFNLLKTLNLQGQVRTVLLENQRWGKTSSKKLLALFPRLESVDFRTCKKVHCLELADWSVERAPLLEAFSWGWAFSVRESELVGNLIRGRGRLRALTLEYLEGMGDGSGNLGTDLTLRALGEHCPQLETLKLEGALRFSDAGVEAFVQGTGAALKSCVLRVKTIFKPSRFATPHDMYSQLTEGAKRQFLSQGASDEQWVANPTTCPKLSTLVLFMPKPYLQVAWKAKKQSGGAPNNNRRQPQ